MVEKRISCIKRLGVAVLALLGILLMFYFADFALSRFGSNALKFFVRVVTIPGVILSVIWFILMSWIAVRGMFKLRTLPGYIISIGIALSFFVVASMMFQFVVPVTWDNPIDWRSIFGIQWAFTAFFFIISIGICMVLCVLYRSEFKTREKLLEIEYRLAEISEKIEKSQQPSKNNN